MNFTAIVNEVVSITERPDKILDIRRAVNATLNRACSIGDFAQDLQEASFNIDGTQYAQNLLLTQFQRFRKFRAIKPSNRAKYLCPTAPHRLFAESVELLDRYYIAGSQVNFKLSVLAPSLLCAWYSYPPELTDAAPDFWLLEASPYMIIEGAAASIFKNIGDDASFRLHEENHRTMLEAAIRDLRYGVQYG